VLAHIRKIRKDDSGFTLIELLMVIVILGILSGIVVLSVRGINDTGEEAACKAEVKTVQVAAEAYYAQEQTDAATALILVNADFLKTLPNTDYVNYNAGDPQPTAGSPCA
jgi:general secretion pathway protein G